MSNELRDTATVQETDRLLRLLLDSGSWWPLLGLAPGKFTEAPGADVRAVLRQRINVLAIAAELHGFKELVGRYGERWSIRDLERLEGEEWGKAIFALQRAVLERQEKIGSSYVLTAFQDAGEETALLWVHYVVPCLDEEAYRFTWQARFAQKLTLVRALRQMGVREAGERTLQDIREAEGLELREVLGVFREELVSARDRLMEAHPVHVEMAEGYLNALDWSVELASHDNCEGAARNALKEVRSLLEEVGLTQVTAESGRVFGAEHLLPGNADLDEAVRAFIKAVWALPDTEKHRTLYVALQFVARTRANMWTRSWLSELFDKGVQGVPVSVPRETGEGPEEIPRAADAAIPPTALREEFAGASRDELLLEIARLRGASAEASGRDFSDATLDELVGTLPPQEGRPCEPPAGLADRMTELVRELQQEPTRARNLEAKHETAQKLNLLLDGYSLRLVLEDGSFARLHVTPYRDVGTFQFGLSGGGSRGFRKEIGPSVQRISWQNQGLRLASEI